MSDSILSQLTMFNQLYKELDDLYHNIARHFDLPYSALWVLYSVVENDIPYTQTDLCEKWHFSKQTVNTILKNLESCGLIQLVTANNNRKSKLIALTESGKELAEKTVVSLKEIEQSTFGGLEENERQEYLRIARKYIDLFSVECQKMFVSSDD